MNARQFLGNPAHNPGVLDTATWDRAAAWRAAQQVGERWLAAHDGAAIDGDVVVYGGSVVRRGAAMYCLAGLPDGQQVFVELGYGGAGLGTPLGEMALSSGLHMAAYPTDAAVIDRYCRKLHPPNRPRTLGITPRLGVGVRMTTAVWPGLFHAMQRGSFAANTIQNSVRELNLLDDILAGRPAPTNYASGFGTIETGYTGSTWEGLWVAGVLAGLQQPVPLQYGADADHLQVKRGEKGLERAKTLVKAARYYTFYTLDMADILDYQYHERSLPDSGEQRAVIAWHRKPLQVGNRQHALDAQTISRMIGKYWDALAALTELSNTISQLKDGESFDLEFTIDEHPPEVAAFDCLTTDEELLFVLREIQRRGLPVTHVAPNFGQEKGWDYRAPDGLPGLEQRLRTQFAIAEAFGVLLDVHSADDLTQPVRRVIRRATGGKVHYKISPMLQLLFAETLAEHDPALFRQWWDDALAYARREASAGSSFATECLKAYETAADPTPSRRHAVFHHFSFAFVGRRDESGRFLHRQAFYELPAAFYRDYEQRIDAYVSGLANDLF